MKKLTLSIVAVIMTVLGLGAVASNSPAYAAQVTCPDGSFASELSACPDYTGVGNKDSDVMEIARTIINWIVGIIGFLAVVMIVIGGLSYTLSQGDSTKVKKAKDTIMYGIIGLVIALLAFAIVNFVLVNVIK